MNEADPIVEEVRRIRDEYAAKLNYDPKAIFQDIKQREKRSGRKYVSFADESVTPKQSARAALPVTPDATPPETVSAVKQ